MLTAEHFHEGKIPMQQIGGKEGGGRLLEEGVFLGTYVIRLLCTQYLILSFSLVLVYRRKEL